MVPFWIPIILRHLIFRVPQKGTIILTTTHIACGHFGTTDYFADGAFPKFWANLEGGLEGSYRVQGVRLRLLGGPQKKGHCSWGLFWGLPI